MVSTPTPPLSLMLYVVVLGLTPFESPIAGVVVSACARRLSPPLAGAVAPIVLCPTQVSVYGSNNCPPGLPECCECFDNWMERLSQISKRGSILRE